MNDMGRVESPKELVASFNFGEDVTITRAEKAALRAESMARHPAVPGYNGFWMLYDYNTGQYVESDIPLPSGVDNYRIGSGLTLDVKTNTLSVDTAESVEKDNTKPITSAAVYTEIGNIEALLQAL